MNCSLFLKNLEKHFYNLTLQKKTSSNILKIYRNIYRRKFIDYRYRFRKLRFIDYRYRPGFFEAIDYRYRYSTKGFIVSIPGRGKKEFLCCIDIGTLLDFRCLYCAKKQPKKLSLEPAFRSLSVSLLVETSGAAFPKLWVATHL